MSSWVLEAFVNIVHGPSRKKGHHEEEKDPNQPKDENVCFSVFHCRNQFKLDKDGDVADSHDRAGEEKEEVGDDSQRSSSKFIRHDGTALSVLQQTYLAIGSGYGRNHASQRKKPAEKDAQIPHLGVEDLLCSFLEKDNASPVDRDTHQAKSKGPKA